MIKAGIVGVSGYSGIELFHILSMHPQAEVIAVSSRTYKDKKLSEIFPHLSNFNIICREYSAEELADSCDVVFTAVPHGGTSIGYAKAVKNVGKKIIDLSADFRLKDMNVYKTSYNTEHDMPELLDEAVYGLPEINREKIKDAWLIANPGCYTTAAILSIIPLLKADLIDEKTIIVDAKSGSSGAGRTLRQNHHFCELDEGVSVYGIPFHRHKPEIEQEISNFSKERINITFTPNLVPMIRGILSVTYSQLKKDISSNELLDIYKSTYKNEPFVRIIENNLPNTKYVSGTNYIDITAIIDEKCGRVIVISAIDNLIKGASGQAVQNMNISFGLEERTGLKFKPIYP